MINFPSPPLLVHFSYSILHQHAAQLHLLFPPSPLHQPLTVTSPPPIYYSPLRSASLPVYTMRPLRFSPLRLSSLSQLPWSWPTSLSIHLPHRLRRKLRSTRSKIRAMQTPTSSIAGLEWSCRPSDTLRALHTHRCTVWDLQYLFLGLLLVGSLAVIESPGPLVKTLVVSVLLGTLAMPVTCQFFLPFLPIAVYLIFFYACQFISGEYRPPIWVRVLPALENILYGANLSNILSAHKATALDVLAWLPYGILHFGAPFVCSGLMFIFGPPGTTPVFARAFGYMCITGVFIQLLFPCAPPWYENKYGLAPANYSMPGSPAGLAAIDRLFGIDLYTSPFTASPMVFGAFPSLHSGNATLEALFMSHVFPRWRPLFVVYTLWLWWATMYLSHHYAVDLVAGASISALYYFGARARWLPRLQPGKLFRWDYDYVEHGDVLSPGASAYSALDYDLPLYDSSNDAASTSAFSSSSSAGPGSASASAVRSPATAEAADDTSSLGWDRDTDPSSFDLLPDLRGSGTAP